MDPATTRAVAAGAVDPISGFANITSGTVYVRDPFYTGGSIAGIRDFTGLTSRLNIIPASRLDPNAVQLLKLLPAPTSAGFQGNYFAAVPSTSIINQYDVRIEVRTV